MKKLIVALCVGLFAFLIVPLTTNADNSELPEEIQQVCVKYGEEYGICPELIMAIVETESSGNQYAENGSCKGLMQVSVNWHSDRMDELGVTDIYDIDGNIHVGTDYLAELFEKYEEASLVLDCFNGNSKAFSNYENGIMSDYATKVLERSAELEQLHGK